MNIFPQQELSDTEKHLLVEIYNNPVVKKHLQIMAMADTIELLRLSGIQTPNEVLIKAHATVQGKLAVVSTLLSIEAPKPTNQEQ
jgi:hypothetical protein